MSNADRSKRRRQSSAVFLSYALTLFFRPRIKIATSSKRHPEGVRVQKSNGRLSQFGTIRRHRQALERLIIIAAVGMLGTSVSAQQPSSSSTQTTARIPGGQLPGYVRPNFAKRFRTYTNNTFGPIRMIRVVSGAAFSQADSVPPEWGQGWGAYGERFASHLGVDFIDGGANLALSEALRDDTTYYSCPCKGVWRRMKYAFFSSVTARRGADGHRVFSIPAVASPYAGSFGTLAWYPRRYGPKDAFRTGNYDLLNSVGATVALEFLNPLLRKIHLE
jgi:hypothetical protein